MTSAIKFVCLICHLWNNLHYIIWAPDPMNIDDLTTLFFYSIVKINSCLSLSLPTSTAPHLSFSLSLFHFSNFSPFICTFECASVWFMSRCLFFVWFLQKMTFKIILEKLHKMNQTHSLFLKRYLNDFKLKNFFSFHLDNNNNNNGFLFIQKS